MWRQAVQRFKNHSLRSVRKWDVPLKNGEDHYRHDKEGDL